MTPDVALLTIQLFTAEDDLSPEALYNAIRPATCGLAIDVPLMVFLPELSHVEVMPAPGAYSSTQLPTLVNPARPSVLLDAATVSTPLADAGE